MTTTILFIILGIACILVFYYLSLLYQNRRDTRVRLYKEKVLKEIELNRPYISKESQNLVIFRNINEDGAQVVKCEVGLKLAIEDLNREEVDRFIGLIKCGAYELRKEFSKHKYEKIVTNMICD